jgi:hypothetical protein
MSQKTINELLDALCKKHNISKQARLEIKLLLNTAFSRGVHAFSRIDSKKPDLNEQDQEIR